MTLSGNLFRDLRKSHAPSDRRVRVRQGSKPGMMTVAWSAADRNGDHLLFRVELRQAGPREPFRVVADDLEYHFHSFDSRALPDGRYVFRVTAIDRPSNPPEEALTDRYVSEPFVIDNGPPKISGLKATSRGKGRLRIEAEVNDQVSALGTAEFSVSGGPWLMLPAEDGLIDNRSEKLVAEVAETDAPGGPKLSKGQQTVLVRVEDEAGNSATASAVLTVR